MACMVNRIGKIITELKLKVARDFVLIDLPKSNKQKAIEWIKKHIISEDVKLEELDFYIYQIHGAKAYDVVKGLVRVPEKNFYFVGGDQIVSNFTFTRFNGVEIYSSQKMTFEHPEFSDELLEAIRVESGFPKWGHEITEELLPIECGLGDIVISYNKGCYIGQEIIQRVKTYSEPAKCLVGIFPEREVKQEGKLMSEGEAGWITSSVFSHSLEKYIALAIVKKEYAKRGTKLRLEDGKEAQVSNLPFV